MNKAILIALAATGIGAASNHKFSRHFELSNYSFDDYLRESGKKYSDNEYNLRRQIFERNFKKIQAHNAAGHSWKMGVNRFTDFTEEELSRTFGGDKYAMEQKSKLQAAPSNADIAQLPHTVDWRNEGVVSAVKDQGHCGSCWAFASTETIESHVAINTGILTEVSPQELVSCMPNTNSCGGTGGCEGATAELAFEYLTQYGLPELWVYGYLPEVYNFGYTNTNGACQRDEMYNTTSGPVAAAPRAVGADGYTLLPRNSYADMMTAIATVGPLAVNVDASTWHAYESGVFTGCAQNDVDINHVVQLVGYGTDAVGGDYWLVRNSWSPEWGELGYIKVKREDGYCGTDYHNSDGVGCNTDPQEVTVCGMCGIMYDSSYPLNAKLV